MCTWNVHFWCKITVDIRLEIIPDIISYVSFSLPMCQLFQQLRNSQVVFCVALLQYLERNLNYILIAASFHRVSGFAHNEFMIHFSIDNCKLILISKYPKYLFARRFGGHSNVTVFNISDPTISCQHPQLIVTNMFSYLV